MNKTYPWSITPEMPAEEKCEAYKEFMMKRFNRTFEYKVQYRLPEKLRAISAKDHLFISTGFYKSIGEFIMWNPALAHYSNFELVHDSEKERPKDIDLYKKDQYYQAVENGYRIELEIDIKWCQMFLSLRK